VRRWELQVGIGITLVGLLLWRAKVWELGSTLRDFDLWTAVLVVLLNIPAIGILAIRTHFVLKRLGYDASAVSLAPVSALGNVAAVVTPGAAGDVIRAPFLKEHHGVSYTDSFATIVYERSYSFAILCLSTAMVALWRAGPVGLRAIIPLIGIVVLAGPLLIAMPLTSLGRWARGKGQDAHLLLRPLVRLLNAAEGRWVRSLARLMTDTRLTFLFAGLTTIIFACFACQVWLISDALSVHLSAGEAALTVGGSVAAGIASFLPLGLGVLDWTMMALLQNAGASVGTATAVAILYRATNSLPAGIAGVAGYGYLVMRLRRAALKMPEAAEATD
jgi:uncharacterized protein (TIRG00374 family)